MNKCLVAFWLLLFPLLAMADATTGSSSLSLAPPVTDYSVSFLGNLFGVVDGVLHGTGTQIMGAMFSVFNSAVLALGGIVIMYTLLVGTMNTAHEGEMLGHKWSSIWIPVRSTAGLALLIPKASGYCLMQIFVMWVVVQGVGAADKVWAAALEYLNRGGVLVQANQSPSSTSLNPGGQDIIRGAQSMLASEVCMLGLQKTLEAARKNYLAMVGTSSPGPCGPDNVNTNGMSGFCSTPVPDLLATVDAVAYQSAQKSSSDTPPTSYAMPVPYFPTSNGVSSNPYAFLQGICGTITWNALPTLNTLNTLSSSPNRCIGSATNLFGTLGGAVSKLGSDIRQGAGLAGGAIKQVPDSQQAMHALSGAYHQGVGFGSNAIHQGANLAGQVPGVGTAVGGIGQGAGIAGGVIKQAGFVDKKDSNNPSQYQISASQQEQMDLIGLTRASAVQQMYLDYQSVAQAMVNNDPQIVVPPANTTGSSPALPWANNVFGVPYSASASMPCVTGTTDCYLWQGGFTQASGSSGAVTGIPIFNGAEFQNGIADYNGVMMPTINLINEQTNSNAAGCAKSFIANAESQGWLSAGSYFFDMVSLSGSATKNQNATDANSGLGTGSGANVGATNLTGAFGGSGNACEGPYATLCSWLSAAPLNPTGSAQMSNIAALIGTNSASALNGKAVTDSDASTVYGFVVNSQIITLPGQPTMTNPNIVANLMPPPQKADTSFKTPTPACGRVNIMGYHFCLGRIILQGFYDMLQGFVSLFINILGVWINNFLTQIIAVPIAALSGVFVNNVNFLFNNPGANPIVQLATMGIDYINAPANAYVGFITMELTVSEIPYVGEFVAGVLLMIFALASPLIVSWFGVMTAVGFTTAFYVPFLPYMVFTFGVIGWLMAVIEAMVAAPIVALGITHPEGEGVMGSKGEHALLILMNVFLRPALMIIGYISAIALCYVSVWVINTGFANVVKQIQGPAYIGWAALYVTFFSVLIYTTMYVTVAQKAFDLIHQLPDHVLRWIGGTPESFGKEAASWTGEVSKQVDKGGEATKEGQAKILEQAGGLMGKMKSGLKSGGSAVKGTGKK